MERFRVTTSWRTLEITSEPYLVLTLRGYVGAVKVIELPQQEEWELLISGIKSLAQGVEPLRVANGGSFVGSRFRLKIEKSLLFSRYLVDQQGIEGLNRTPDWKPPTGEASQSNEDKLWDHILRQYGHESFDFRVENSPQGNLSPKGQNDETGIVIPHCESSLSKSIEEPPPLLEAEAQGEESS